MKFDFKLNIPFWNNIVLQSMGNCTKGNQPRAEPPESLLKKGEIALLELMFADLSCRSVQNFLTRETFDTFFHSNGLWGQEMFRVFDQKRIGGIDFEQFSSSIGLMVKGSFLERSKMLFNFYDADKKGGISYSQLLRMLYSYPKEELEKMMMDDNFTNSIENNKLAEYFGPERVLIEKNIVEEDEDDQQAAKDKKKRKGSVFEPESQQFLEMQKNFAEFLKEKRNLKERKPFTEIIQDNLPPQKNGKKFSGKRGSMSVLPTCLRQKNMKLTNNVAALVKKYAAFIFNELKLDRKVDSIDFKNFQIIISNHRKIFTAYFEGFHSHIWMMDDSMLPLWMSITPWIEGECEEVYKGERSMRYLKFIKTSILVFTSNRAKTPIQIKNLQGLYVEPYETGQEYGIVVKHRDGIYPQKIYVFEEEKVQKQWVRLLSEFRINSIYNEYQIIEKIGAGNFSSVYRGVSKREQGREVAIKSIEKFKLSLNEKEVIKLECGILQLCHHPSIITFFKQYSTKSNIYIVTELLNDGDLFEYTQKSTFLEEFEAAIIFKQLCEAICYLNEDLGLIHRDLKPENVLVVLNKEKAQIKRVKIIDFGFAVYKSNLKNLSRAQKYAGTPGFVAPEVFKGEDFDQGIDMFSLGVILFFMLSGYFPFYSSIYEEIVEQTKECQISFQNAHWMNVSPDAKDLLSKILTFKKHRISIKSALEHPWVQNAEQLKQYSGVNKKNRYI